MTTKRRIGCTPAVLVFIGICVLYSPIQSSLTCSGLSNLWRVCNAAAFSLSIFAFYSFFTLVLCVVVYSDNGAGTAQWLERRTRDWKIVGSSPGSEGIFPSELTLVLTPLPNSPSDETLNRGPVRERMHNDLART